MMLRPLVPPPALAPHVFRACAFEERSTTAIAEPELPFAAPSC